MGHRVEKLYPYVPVWAQNIGISLYGYLWRHERLGGKFSQYVDEFRERDYWNTKQMDSYLQHAFTTQVLHAIDQTRYYAERFAAAGLHRKDLESLSLQEIARLPITKKEDLRKDPEAFVAASVKRAASISRYQSSGTTGTPITSICTADDHRRYIAAREVRSLGWANASIRMPRAMLGGRRIVPSGTSAGPFYRYNAAEKQIYLSAYHLGPDTVADYVRGLRRHAPRLMTGYANSYAILARLMIEAGLRLDSPPVAVVTSSEKLTVEMKKTIWTGIGARAFEEYGSVENCVLGTECEHGSLHVNPDFGILEIIDDAGQPVPKGEIGRIICTSLLSTAQPLIRYEIGDLGAWATQPCPCGREHLPVLQDVVGRLEDLVVCTDGRQMVRFHWVYVDLPNILEGQIVQEEPEVFLVRLVAKERGHRETEEIIRRRFSERIGEVRVRFEYSSEIRRTARGKFRAVISLLSEEQKRALSARRSRRESGIQ